MNEKPYSTSPPASLPIPATGPEISILRCPVCDYDLRGSTTLQCPECGRQWTRATITRAQRVLESPGFIHLYRSMAFTPIEFWKAVAARIQPAAFLAFVTTASLVFSFVIVVPASLWAQNAGAWTPTASWLTIPVATFGIAAIFWLLLALYASLMTSVIRARDHSADGQGWAIAAAAAVWLPLWIVFVTGETAKTVISNVYWSTSPIEWDLWLPRIAWSAATMTALFAGLAMRGILMSANRHDLWVGGAVACTIFLNPLNFLLLLLML